MRHAECYKESGKSSHLFEKPDKIDNVQRARTRHGEASLLFLKRNVQWCVNGVEHLVARKIRYANASP